MSLMIGHDRLLMPGGIVEPGVAHAEQCVRS
jgi:hypothetical protein